MHCRQGSLWLYLVVAVLVALAIWTWPQPSQESFQAQVDVNTLRGRTVEVVRTMPRGAQRDRSKVYLHVDSNGRLVSNPRLPFSGDSLAQVQQALIEKFGAKTVRATTMRPPDARSRADTVWIVYDASTRKVTRVAVPPRWAMPPRMLDIQRKGTPTFVALNPKPGEQFKGRTLVVRTGKGNTVTSVALHS
jgi:hypothetical protein